MSQMSIALLVFTIGGLWYANRYMAKLPRGKSATLINGRIYAALLFVGLVLALLWA